MIIGNSQAGALKRAHDARRDALAARGVHAFFHVVPGGLGPDFDVVDQRLVVRSQSETHPAYSDPPSCAAMRLDEFDAILFSALGHFDGGFAYVNQISIAGVLAECGPRGVARNRPPLSDTCYQQLMAAMFERQPGVAALRRICAAYGGPVYVQRFPKISEAIVEHPQWGLRTWYTAPVKAYSILSSMRDAALMTIAHSTGAILLDYPVTDTASGLTPRHLMRDSDLIHQSEAYADLLLLSQGQP
ncbi:MAG: hypothetical protein KJZ59_08210 [Pararhodobacter sp.]|nr:hypothetical protein [Pararhodobacter sp.]